ncbi:MAG: DNA polymerase III subunit beta [Mesorhizobium sp.]|uniref:DNA polymerase III subunit beta n=1 Tax=unclassified Mesorhizobium TaxID=325217 RepID=UPI000FCB59B9|nr:MULTISPECIES: DNA polymerase III subunit beta [unclassified Mesorhizobium]RUV72587.1 DNA polymerase III subunit beta [Mesorhizobium sp. M5C.F.Cr.IN.023.01.1.1]RWF88181.1 MAG: DNA polymerase III subunit beta [Mesorhizobium sp.]RWF91574.1 MAG: DNA polymerase III subunit beta [Mesorhizobium sp.]RWH48220.1 MAG: DNA polymerase III subunit beta [Mesorhizobium sp.]RWI40720.1 MAG: DNA polymerase III subunit beta [Mesorhizobium sp.]
MRVVLERSNLLKSLNHVHRVVERRNTIPILSNVLLSAEGTTLEMKATDLDLEVTEATPAKVERGGATTVPAHLLYDIVRKLADGAEVMLKSDEDGNAMTVTSGRSSFRLQCLPQSDFPELSAGSFSHIFRLDSVALKGLIEKTQFAISTEETRYYLNGIYLHTHDADGKLKLRSVATDGHRLARAEIDAPAGSEGMPGIIIPRKTVSELQKLVDDPNVAVTTELSDTKIRFTIGSVVLTSKLIDGTFPDYQRVIPTGNDKKLIIDRQSFAAAVDRVSTISSERGRAVKLSIGEGQVTLAVNNPDSGSATEELAADYSSDAIEIGFNAKYLLDVAAQLTGTEAKFMLADAGSPTLIHDMADETTLYVLMPMRV